MVLCAIATPAVAELQTPGYMNITSDASYRLLIPSESGGVTAFGETRDESGKSDIAVRRVQADMSTAWTLEFAGSKYENDWLLDAAEAPDGAVTILGWIQDDDHGWTERKLLVARVSSTGEVEWTREFADNGLNGSWNSAHKARLTTGPDGRTCIVDNIAYESIQVRSLDNQGNLEWASSIDRVESGIEMSLEIQLNDDGDVLVGGLWSDQDGSGHFYTSLDAGGTEQWTHLVNPEGTGLSERSFIKVDSQGNWRVAGNLSGGNWSSSVYVALLTPEGDLKWMTPYSHQEADSIIVTDVALQSDDSVLIGGACWFPAKSIFAMKVGPNGSIDWSHVNLQLFGDDDHLINGMATHEDGRIELTGTYSQSVDAGIDAMQMAVSLSADGDVIETGLWNHAGFADESHDVAVDSHGHVYICGFTNNTSMGNQSDGMVMKIRRCEADVQGDGLVGVDDLLLVLSAYGTDQPNADLNDDGSIDVSDVLFILKNWDDCGD
ncbi:MAG: hypothetical protein CMJ40_09785 [Phycisphaerae bacterium]|nr:hypothetical protein [Phycisphaerae bacterium]